MLDLKPQFGLLQIYLLKEIMVMVSFVVKLPESGFCDIIGYLLGTTGNVKLLSITIFNIQFLKRRITLYMSTL